VWGQHRRGVRGCAGGRLTPTRVGTTRDCGASPAARSAHPHACGDDPHARRPSEPERGSPPRVWGRLQRRLRPLRLRWLTPTRVGTTRWPTPRALESTAHPHACGDDLHEQSLVRRHGGSPPRVWGRHGRQPAQPDVLRLTPTRVGTTRRVNGGYLHLSAHPHACGDDWRSSAAWRSAAGSPPRVWGRRLEDLAERLLERLTPTRVGTTRSIRRASVPVSAHPHACGDDCGSIRDRRTIGWLTPTRVGTTAARFARASWCSAHPHACGDDLLRAHVKRQTAGSPPRVWGRHALPQALGTDARLTPTRVGTTWTPRGSRSRPSAHPHACGDDVYNAIQEQLARGSPPRVWGRLQPLDVPGNGVRLTPTRVGTTLTGFSRASRRAAHPHACGDDGHALVERFGHYGSPPRVWGRRAHVLGLDGAGRLTPTRVGTTPRRSSSASTWPAHPHACGDDEVHGAFDTLDAGSPPRVWGRRLRHRQRRRADRLTPTRVGTTRPCRPRSRARAAHPHACGDDLPDDPAGYHDGGSPPRVWGRRGRSRGDARGPRLTPTRVGTTSTPSTTS